MTDTFTQDPEKIVAALRGGHEEFMAATRKTLLEAAEAMEQTLGMLADAEEQLADTTDIEWMSRLLRARAGFTRDLLSASSRFARELLVP